VESLESWALVTRSGITLALAGYAHRGGCGVPWVLGTPELVGYALSFCRASRQLLKVWLERCGRLQNYVWDQHAEAIRWLHWLGFELGAPEPYGGRGGSFRPFWIAR